MHRLPAIVIWLAFAASGGMATAQNDWQYPDPYFGILEIEKSHAGSPARRPRPQVTADPRTRTTTPRSGWFRQRRTPAASRQR
jgi:hypothetical protein